MHVPFTTMGSGSLAAMGVLETKYRDGMTQQEAVDLVKDAIEAGIFHDLGSGSNVDIYVVKRDGAEKKENYRVYDKKVFTNASTYTFPKGTSPVLEEIQYKWKNIEIVDENVPMDIY
jgi:20S proteasome subunit beta 2